MDVEIQNTMESFSVDEYIIREAPNSESNSNKLVPHFQAKVNKTKSNKKRHIKCLLSYYDESNNFLGLDEGYGYHESGLSSEVNFALTIPENTRKAICEFREEQEDRGFYYWAGRVLTSLILIFIVIWLYNYVD
jgi:hypothetical protein